MKREITLEQFRRWLILYAQLIAEAEARLTELDAAIGDADHGVNMQRGMSRVRQRMETVTLAPTVQTTAQSGATAESGPADQATAAEGESRTAQAGNRATGERVDDIGGLLRHAAMTLISSVGGAAGPLYGAFFLWASKSVGTEQTVDLEKLSVMLRTGLEGVQQRGKAQPGEKTMIDALAPAVEAVEEANRQDLPLLQALEQAVRAAQSGMEATIEMQARKGRASYLGPRSVGHLDPGAASAFLLVRAAADCLGEPASANAPGASADGPTDAATDAGDDAGDDAGEGAHRDSQEESAAAESAGVDDTVDTTDMASGSAVATEDAVSASIQPILRNMGK